MTTKEIIEKYKKEFNENLSQKQENNLTFLLDKLLNSNLLKTQIAYILATVKHETANTYEPIEEFGKGKGKKYGEVDKTTGKAYYGRGYIQLTWKNNYEKLGKRLNYPLVKNPELLLNPTISFEILLVTMLEGLATGFKLSQFINENITDFYNARKVVNGLDKAEKIKSYAEQFLKILP